MRIDRFVAVACLVPIAAGMHAAAHGAADLVPSITDTLPPGQVGPKQRVPQPPGLPVQAPYPVADWWFSQIFKWSAAPSQVPQGNTINPLPLVMNMGFNGLAIYAPYPEHVDSTVACGGGSTACPGFQAIPPQTFVPEVVPGLVNGTTLAAYMWPTDPVAKVHGFSTWSVTFDMPASDGTHILRATAARGSPYVWIEFPDTTDASDFSQVKVEVNDASSQIFGGADQPFKVWTGASGYAASVNAQTGSTARDPAPNQALVTVNGRTHLLLGPDGSHWEWKNFTPPPYTTATFYNVGVRGGAGSRWAVIAALPANTDSLVAAGQWTRADAVSLLASHAHFRPANETSRTATRLACSYAPQCAGTNVTGVFSYESLVDIRTGAAAPADQDTLFALFPHQQANLTTSGVLIAPHLTYSSAKGYARGGKEPSGGFTEIPPPPDAGQMQLAKGRSFTIGYTLPAIPPVVPPTDGASYTGAPAKLESYLVEDVTKYDHGDGIDTYNWGKHLSRLANNLEIATQTSSPTAASYKASLSEGLSGWFSAKTTDGSLKPIPTQIPDGPGLFWYDATWGTLIGFPAGFGSNEFLNDHHFHYGYFIRAAAVLGSHDASWLATYRPYVELLIRDIAADYGDSATVDGIATQFAAYNYFDPYSGHSNAAGVQQYANGINQESSSEAVNAWYGTLLWGALVGDADLTARAAFMYCSETDAARRYWFQEESQVAGTNPVTSGTLGNVFDNVYQYAGFSPGPQYLHIINWLPFGGGAAYLAANKEYALHNYQRLVAEFGSTSWTAYPDLIWMYRAISDQADAQAQFEATIGNTVGENFTCDSGNTLAMTYLWIWSAHEGPPTATAGDFDGDGAVNGPDLGVLLGHWGTPNGDLNCDQTTDGADLSILLGAWTG